MAEPPRDDKAYDVNFCFPIRELENERVKLTPFVPSVHAEPFHLGSAPHQELWQFLPFGPFSDTTSLLKELIEGRIQPDPAIVLFAIIDKTRPPSESPLAGVLGYLNTSQANLSTEIGFVIVLPPFQRTHVTTNAVGLLMLYALDLPSQGGLGLRRLQWQANVLNTKSVRTAERMGFKREGTLRWERVLPGGRGKMHNGIPLREGDPRPGTLGRDTAMLALCWDDWETEREKVIAIMERHK
ncbi:acyl-CoA N-acyltransferase [Leucogyrophana mollusca]|uniref:Acyl-CoA N-acyltransferase n=1 Tax=Leucogyrophana mollusca TaxID=85980 RepID=A0ACB8BMK6_9AGAM|nr:acyl-CoA N-acyltransferase [Leucogyrophana mollusca]